MRRSARLVALHQPPPTTTVATTTTTTAVAAATTALRRAADKTRKVVKVEQQRIEQQPKQQRVQEPATTAAADISLTRYRRKSKDHIAAASKHRRVTEQLDDDVEKEHLPSPSHEKHTTKRPGGRRWSGTLPVLDAAREAFAALNNSSSSNNNNTKRIGAHVSAAGGPHHAVYNAVFIGADAFAMDLRSKRRWECPPTQPEHIELFHSALTEFNFTTTNNNNKHNVSGHEVILPHGSYLINCGSPDPEVLRKSKAALLDELKRCEMLGLTRYNVHPGSTCGLVSVEDCLQSIAQSVNEALAQTRGVTVVLENTAGQGGCVGWRFEELAGIIELVQDKSRVGVCIDTCHLFAAGYDIRTREAFNKTMEEFDRIVGFKYLRGCHLNDSKQDLGSRRDNHESIGDGHIGLEAFHSLMNDMRFDGIPLILETPYPEGDGPKDVWKDKYAREINLLRSMQGAPPDAFYYDPHSVAAGERRRKEKQEEKKKSKKDMKERERKQEEGMEAGVVAKSKARRKRALEMEE
eukprot:jgi/Chlat1/6933/Chrsp52S00518